MAVAGARQHPEAREQLELDPVHVQQVALGPLAALGDLLVAEALGKLHGERLRAALVGMVEQVTQLLEPVVAAGVELGDQRAGG